MDKLKALHEAREKRAAFALAIAGMVASGEQARNQEGFGRLVGLFQQADAEVVALSAEVTGAVQTGGPVE